MAVNVKAVAVNVKAVAFAVVMADRGGSSVGGSLSR